SDENNKQNDATEKENRVPDLRYITVFVIVSDLHKYKQVGKPREEEKYRRFGRTKPEGSSTKYLHSTGVQNIMSDFIPLLVITHNLFRVGSVLGNDIIFRRKNGRNPQRITELRSTGLLLSLG